MTAIYKTFFIFGGCLRIRVLPPHTSLLGGVCNDTIACTFFGVHICRYSVSVVVTTRRLPTAVDCVGPTPAKRIKCNAGIGPTNSIWHMMYDLGPLGSMPLKSPKIIRQRQLEHKFIQVCFGFHAIEPTPPPNSFLS